MLNSMFVYNRLVSIHSNWICILLSIGTARCVLAVQGIRGKEGGGGGGEERERG